MHYDKSSKNKKARLYQHSAELLQDIISQVNSFDDIDFVIFTGDVTNLPKKQDLKSFIAEANKLDVPYYVLAGNHDIGVNGGTSKKDFIRIINNNSKNQKINNTYFSFEPNKSFKIIALDGVIGTRVTANGFYGLKQQKWLKNELKTDKNIILASHFPLVEPIRSPSHVTINANALLKLLNKNTIAFISGHYHVHKNILKNNTLHMSTPALVEYPNTIRIIEIKKLKNNGVQIKTKLIPTNLKQLQEKSRKLKKASKSTKYLEEEVYIIGESK